MVRLWFKARHIVVEDDQAFIMLTTAWQTKAFVCQQMVFYVAVTIVVKARKAGLLLMRSLFNVWCIVIAGWCMTCLDCAHHARTMVYPLQALHHQSLGGTDHQVLLVLFTIPYYCTCAKPVQASMRCILDSSSYYICTLCISQHITTHQSSFPVSRVVTLTREAPETATQASTPRHS